MILGLGILSVFSLGLMLAHLIFSSAGVSGLIKMFYLRIGNSSWNMYNLTVWTSSEIFLVISCGSIPTLRPTWDSVRSLGTFHVVSISASRWPNRCPGILKLGKHTCEDGKPDNQRIARPWRLKEERKAKFSDRSTGTDDADREDKTMVPEDSLAVLAPRISQMEQAHITNYSGKGVFDPGNQLHSFRR